MQLAGLIRNLQYPDVLELVLQILKCELFQSYTIIHLVLCYLTGPGVKNAHDRSELSHEGFDLCKPRLWDIGLNHAPLLLKKYFRV